MRNAARDSVVESHFTSRGGISQRDTTYISLPLWRVMIKFVATGHYSKISLQLAQRSLFPCVIGGGAWKEGGNMLVFSALQGPL